MSLQSDNKLYEEILSADSFLNDLFTSEDAMTKFSILEKAGFNLEEEYRKWQEEFSAKHNEKLEL